MSDYLLNLSDRAGARRVISSLGLPIPMPQRLDRAEGPRVERCLEGRSAVVGGTGDLRGEIARALARAGASTAVAGDRAAFLPAAEAFGRPVVDEPSSADALVFDGTDLAAVADLRRLYDFFHPRVRSVARGGRIVVLARPPAGGVEAASARAAVEGFVRSLAKEVGRKGATANLIRVATGAEGRIEGPLRFILSRRSAFVTGQPLDLDTAAASGDAPLTASLDGRVALVTGAARGIGEATARRLAAEGATVVCLDRPEDAAPLAAVAREIGGRPLLVDVTAPEAAARIVEVVNELGGVDVVVHNAGVTRDRTLGNLGADAWDLTLAVNLDAILRVNAALLDASAVRDGGRIVLLASIAGIAGNVGQTNYAASKAGVIGVVRALAPVVADRGITVNAVAPGFIETRLTAAIPVATREAARRLSALSQGGLPVDVADAITFLASPGASGLTGRVLRVCGGNFIGA